MDKFNFSVKNIAINKANTQILIAVGVASFVTVFCLVASKAVYSQYQYQGRVISATKNANNELQNDVSAYTGLLARYNGFETQQNIVLSNINNSSNANSVSLDNVQIALDSLPAEYDFPGLTSDIENILYQSPVQVSGITGTDAGTAAGATSATAPATATTSSTASATLSTGTPAIAMPFGFTVTKSTYASIVKLIQIIQQSTRPMSIDTIGITAEQGSLSLNVSAHSYYQPATKLSISQETVK